MNKPTSKFYLVGIKGTGMSALAVYLKQEGNIVIGSDVNKRYFTDANLIENNINILNYNCENINGEYIYIIGLSINKENVEFNEILKHNYEYYYYNDFIGQLKREMICVSGTHGKTTTTSFLYQLGENNISAIIGDGTGYSNINNKYVVIESCEYKNHFLKYYPILGVILNIELDHPDFFKNIKDVIKSFQMFSDNCKTILVNGDDINIKKIKHFKKITFGFNKDNDYVIKILEEHKEGYLINISGKDLDLNYISLPGIHNIYNLAGAIISLHILNINIPIKKLEFPKRRMNEEYIYNTIVIDDYAHHPTEIKSLISSVKQKYPEYKTYCIFQSHTYSRTLKFKKEFKKVLQLVDVVYIRDVFSSSREKVNIKKQKRINRYFNSFKKYHCSIFDNIDYHNKNVIMIIGATPSDEVMNDIKRKKR